MPTTGTRPPLLAVPGIGKTLLIPTAISLTAVVLFALTAMSFYHGAFSGQGSRYHNLNVIAVDYDGGIVGQSVRAASARLQRPQFPAIDFVSSDRYRDSTRLKRAVCDGASWAAISVEPGATQALLTAIGRNMSVEGENAARSLRISYNALHFPSVANNLDVLFSELALEANRELYQIESWRSAVADAARNSSVEWSLVQQPILRRDDLIAPNLTPMKALYNTGSLLWPALFQFFVSLGITLRFVKNGLYARATPNSIYSLRFGIGKLSACLLAIVAPGPRWTVVEQSSSVRDHFGLQWLVFVLYYDVQWQMFESFIAGLLNLRYVSYFSSTWLLCNATSCLLPTELMPAFYKILWFFPTKHIYHLLLRAWTGCNADLHVVLPVLFTWWAVGHVLVWFAMRRNCRVLGGGAPRGPPPPAGVQPAPSGPQSHPGSQTRQAPVAPLPAMSQPQGSTLKIESV